jgi:hypothetical protein
MGGWVFGWLASDGFMIDAASCGRGQWPPCARPADSWPGAGPEADQAGQRRQQQADHVGDEHERSPAGERAVTGGRPPPISVTRRRSRKHPEPGWVMGCWCGSPGARRARAAGGCLSLAGPELDDLAYQTAADALIAITAKLGQFRVKAGSRRGLQVS